MAGADLKMKLKLIPVIELGHANQGIKPSEQARYQENPADRDSFNNVSRKKAEDTDALEPFDPGLSLYEIEKISDHNLGKIVLDHTEEFRKGEYERDESSPLFGGYVLEIEGERLFYPQCCGDLGDIQFWRNIAEGRQSYYEGHPAPTVRFERNEIIFDLNIGKFDEEFSPIPQKRIFKFKQGDLANAIKFTELILKKFVERIRLINEKERLNIERIEDLLVWENSNYQ